MYEPRVGRFYKVYIAKEKYEKHTYKSVRLGTFYYISNRFYNSKCWKFLAYVRKYFLLTCVFSVFNPIFQKRINNGKLSIILLKKCKNIWHKFVDCKLLKSLDFDAKREVYYVVDL